jgi:RNA polymerase sigma-70 factor (ECF subfamily)
VNAVEQFEAQRGRLQAIAYGMLGSVSDAEDVVQDAFLRWDAADRADVRSPEAFLTTVTTRLALDRLRSAQRRREEYVGPWLPEPLVVDLDDPARVVADAEQLSYALLATLERLNPVERAVFLLRDVFDLDYAEIAAIVERSDANCRQIAHRARERIGRPVRGEAPPRPEEWEVAARFADAIRDGDLEGLKETLAADVVAWTDAGGTGPAALNPIYGADKVARFLLAIVEKSPAAAIAALVNGGPGFWVVEENGRSSVAALEIADGAVVGIRAVINPAKLAHLAPPAM